LNAYAMFFLPPAVEREAGGGHGVKSSSYSSEE